MSSLSIRRNILKFHFTKNDTLMDKMIVYLNFLSPGMEDGVLRELDVVEVVAVDRRRIRHFLMQILK